MGVRSAIDWSKAILAMKQAGAQLKGDMAAYMAARAAVHCPVDTGFLRSSILVVSPSASDAVHVVATAGYAPFVEFGHHAGGTWVAPQPFMRTAMADTIAAFPQLAGRLRVERPGEHNSIQHLGATFRATT